MERNERGTKVIAIIALCVAIVGLSIGFAAFTKDLNITFSDSNVNVSGDLDIKFLASNNPDDTNTIVNGGGYKGANTDIDESIVVTPAIISSDRTTISGIGATFNDKDQGAYYRFYIYNNSEYDAYLKSVDFLNYAGAETNKVCTAMEGTTQSLVDAACEDIHIGVGIGVYDDLIFDTSRNDFNSVKISKGEIVSVEVGIGYYGERLSEDYGVSGGTSLLPNGDFKINFGDIKFSFSSLEG